MNYNEWRKEYSENCHKVMAPSIGSFVSDKSDGKDTGSHRTASIEQALFRLWGKDATSPRFSKLIASDAFSDALEGMGRIIFPQLDSPRQMVGAMVLLLGWAPQEKDGKITFIKDQKSFKDLPIDQKYVRAFEAGFSLGLDPNEVLGQPRLQWGTSGWKELFQKKADDHKKGIQKYTATGSPVQSEPLHTSVVSSFNSSGSVLESDNNTDSIKNAFKQQIVDSLQQIEATVRQSIVEQRVGQDLLRKLLLEAYRRRCAMCDVDAPDLLRASHIIPWASRDSTRLDPKNVILLCGLHDLAFENKFITVASDYRIQISEAPPGLKAILETITHEKLALPMSPECCPEQEYLREHRTGQHRTE